MSVILGWLQNLSTTQAITFLHVLRLSNNTVQKFSIEVSATFITYLGNYQIHIKNLHVLFESLCHSRFLV
jgi:hypothetical protein